MLNKDYRDMLHILSDEKVKFLLVGADGIQFEETFKRSISIDIEGLKVQIPSLDDMINSRRIMEMKSYGNDLRLKK